MSERLGMPSSYDEDIGREPEDGSPDDELTAMQAIVDAFTPLADFEQARVLRWAADRYHVTLGNDHA